MRNERTDGRAKDEAAPAGRKRGPGYWLGAALMANAAMATAFLLFRQLHQPWIAPLPEVLASAPTAQVYRGDLRAGNAALVADLSEDVGEEKRYMEMLRRRCRSVPGGGDAPVPSSVDLRVDIPPTPQTYRVLLRGPSKLAVTISYGYASDSGLLGKGAEWCRVPDELRVWLKAKSAAVTAPP